MEKTMKYTLIASALLVGVILLMRKGKGSTGKMKQPTPGRISSAFGDRIHPVTGKKQFHNGIDIAAPNGTPIIAPMDGVVTISATDETNGNYIILTHPNGYKTGYSHLSSKLVKAGQKVAKGEKIGLVGSTGRSTGNHLHYTVTNPNGEKVDPLKLIA